MTLSLVDQHAKAPECPEMDQTFIGGISVAIEVLAQQFDGCTTQITDAAGRTTAINISDVIRTEGMRVVMAYGVAGTPETRNE